MYRQPKPVSAKQVRHWRETVLHMTQAEAAHYFRISTRSWNRYENGHSPPPGWLTHQVRGIRE